MRDRLKFARETAGLSIATMAARLGVKPEYYRQWENGTRPQAARKRMAEIATITHFNVEWLLAGRGAPKKGKEHPVLELYESLDGAKQSQVIDFMRFLKPDSSH